MYPVILGSIVRELCVNFAIIANAVSVQQACESAMVRQGLAARNRRREIENAVAGNGSNPLIFAVHKLDQPLHCVRRSSLGELDGHAIFARMSRWIA